VAQIDEAINCGGIVLDPMVPAAAVGTCNPAGAFCDGKEAIVHSSLRGSLPVLRVLKLAAL